jgi:hypothetical protein
MSLYFEELDYRQTPIGALSLRRRRELRLGVDVFEIKLGDDAGANRARDSHVQFCQNDELIFLKRSTT